MLQIDTPQFTKPVMLFDQDDPRTMLPYNWDNPPVAERALFPDNYLSDDQKPKSLENMISNEVITPIDQDDWYAEADAASHRRGRRIVSAGIGAAAAYLNFRHPGIAQPVLSATAEQGDLASSLMISAQPNGMEAASIPVNTARIALGGLKEVFKQWRESDAMEKIKRPIRGSMAWANLIFGEAMALGVQGHFQGNNTSSLRSFLIGAGAALAVESGFSLNAARRNKEKQSAETVAEAMAIAPWLGGAMAVENKKLPLRQAHYAIGGYMILGTALAAAAEYNDLAAKAVSQKAIIIPSLMAYGVIKKVHEHFEYKGLSERMADKSAKLAKSVMGRQDDRHEN